MTRDGRPASPRQGRDGERGYNLVVLAVIIALLNIWIASILPLWSLQINREKENELIFRGMQYAEAIRVFQQRFQRYPTKLEELIEVEPRCIRQLWDNPMREDGRWGLIPVGTTPGRRGQQLQNTGLPEPEPDSDGFGEDQEEGENGAPPGVILSADRSDDFFGTPPSSVPIRGVFHPTSDSAIRMFLGSDTYSQWQFTVELVSAMQQGTPDSPGFVRPFRARDIGLPWPPGVQPQVPQPSPNAKPEQNPGVSGSRGSGDGRLGDDARRRAEEAARQQQQEQQQQQQSGNRP